MQRTEFWRVYFWLDIILSNNQDASDNLGAFLTIAKVYLTTKF